MATRQDERWRQAFAPLREVEPTERELAALRNRLAIRQRPRRQRLRVALVVAIFLLLAIGAAAAFFDFDEWLDERIEEVGPLPSSGDPALDRLIAEARTRPEFAPLARSFSFAREVRDPGGGPSWVLVVWRTRTGGWCEHPGRRVGGRVGGLTRSGHFIAFPFQEGRSCTAAPLADDVATVNTDTYPGGPTVVHGVAGDSVAVVRVSGLGENLELRPGKRGGLLAVVDREERRPQLRVEAELRDGTTRLLEP